jgi:hypothetical protein
MRVCSSLAPCQPPRIALARLPPIYETASSRFYGIIIGMYYDDHPPLHFHVQYGEYKAKIQIDTLSIIGGSLPGRALGLVVEWASLHRDELLDRWHNAENNQELLKIQPLQ